MRGFMNTHLDPKNTASAIVVSNNLEIWVYWLLFRNVVQVAILGKLYHGLHIPIMVAKFKFLNSNRVYRVTQDFVHPPWSWTSGHKADIANMLGSGG